jgi:hypothetical protein
VHSASAYSSVLRRLVGSSLNSGSGGIRYRDEPKASAEDNAKEDWFS